MHGPHRSHQMWVERGTNTDASRVMAGAFWILREGQSGFINTYYEWAELKCFHKGFLASRCINWLDQNAEGRKRQQRERLKGHCWFGYASYACLVSECHQKHTKSRKVEMENHSQKVSPTEMYFSVHPRSEHQTPKITFRSSNLWTNNCTIRKCVLVKDVKIQIQAMTTVITVM